MNQKVIIGIIAAIIVIGGVLLLSKKSDAPTDVVGEGSDVTGMERTMRTQSESTVGRGAISELLAQGRPMNCSFVHNNAEMGTGNGVGYFDGKRMRVDSNLMKDGMAFESHVIHDGKTLYTWTKSSEGNFAFMMPAVETEADATVAEQNDSRDVLEENVEYSCDPWSPDEGKFIPPSDIEFSDMSKMMGGAGMMQGTGTMMMDADDMGQMGGMDPEAIEEMMKNLPTQ